MPVVLRYKKVRFVFYSNDHLPIHVRAIYGNFAASCKIIAATLAVEDNKGFSQKDLFLLQEVVQKNRELIEDAWHEFFKK